MDKFSNQKAQLLILFKKKKKERPNHMLPRTGSLQLYAYIQAQSQGMKKDIPTKWKPKENRGTNLYLYLRKETVSQKG